MATGNEIDRRDRKLGDVVLPQVKRLTNRGAPPPQELGPLEQLLGIWTGNGTGWNMIALPFQNAPSSPAGFKFRFKLNPQLPHLLRARQVSTLPSGR